MTTEERSGEALDDESCKITIEEFISLKGNNISEEQMLKKIDDVHRISLILLKIISQKKHE